MPPFWDISQPPATLKPLPLLTCPGAALATSTTEDASKAQATDGGVPFSIPRAKCCRPDSGVPGHLLSLSPGAVAP